ncbi:MAG: hypothetical protein SCARUB_03614 [Candidatus Scalindua rubra]|uniref:DUF2442 domain-containing protein n=1 Tax=Candidatus Scalindua rubra TaxID=1872076 RepID=A0A1E3X6V2_9BACT|nr:MAG: hypothetical protein SCARUB_03614 [Candidatus Scalindua rubra]
MSHCIYRVQSFEIVAPFTLCITFDDGSTQTINFKSILVGKLYGQLSDLPLFNELNALRADYGRQQELAPTTSP